MWRWYACLCSLMACPPPHPPWCSTCTAWQHGRRYRRRCSKKLRTIFHLLMNHYHKMFYQTCNIWKRLWKKHLGEIVNTFDSFVNLCWYQYQTVAQWYRSVTLQRGGCSVVRLPCPRWYPHWSQPQCPLQRPWHLPWTSHSHSWQVAPWWAGPGCSSLHSDSFWSWYEDVFW